MGLCNLTWVYNFLGYYNLLAQVSCTIFTIFAEGSFQGVLITKQTIKDVVQPSIRKPFAATKGLSTQCACVKCAFFWCSDVEQETRIQTIDLKSFLSGHWSEPCMLMVKSRGMSTILACFRCSDEDIKIRALGDNHIFLQ